ncbi:D-2-hydroxyacid dehydrogenase [Orrella sp. JC864]|uniref:D-2-hydroxyacid dehydrogenase n=1 Tax=Orrella sp. JC864 TaxID=3120298 RepID=UPI00300A5763
MQATVTRPLRILLSSQCADNLGAQVAAALGRRPHEIVRASPRVDDAPGDVDIGFISRDVTGLSTKHVVQEPLQAFYASLRRSPALRWVHVHSAGADRPIFAELRERGVQVSTSPGANAEVVAQTALAGVLALARHFPLLLEAQRRREWVSLVASGLPADLAGQHAIVVGWGPIGQRIAGYLRMLGLRVTVARRQREPGAGPDLSTIAYAELDIHAAQADWLVLACPLTEQTRGLVGPATLAAIKPGARLVNVARGEVIVQASLEAALRESRLSGAYLDVFEFEPLPRDSALWQMPNVIVTPHSAGHSDGNERRVARIFLDLLGQWRD